MIKRENTGLCSDALKSIQNIEWASADVDDFLCQISEKISDDYLNMKSLSKNGIYLSCEKGRTLRYVDELNNVYMVLFVREDTGLFVHVRGFNRVFFDFILRILLIDIEGWQRSFLISKVKVDCLPNDKKSYTQLIDKVYKEVRQKTLLDEKPYIEPSVDLWHTIKLHINSNISDNEQEINSNIVGLFALGLFIGLLFFSSIGSIYNLIIGAGVIFLAHIASFFLTPKRLLVLLAVLMVWLSTILPYSLLAGLMLVVWVKSYKLEKKLPYKKAVSERKSLDDLYMIPHINDLKPTQQVKSIEPTEPAEHESPIRNVAFREVIEIDSPINSDILDEIGYIESLDWLDDCEIKTDYLAIKKGYENILLSDILEDDKQYAHELMITSKNILNALYEIHKIEQLHDTQQTSEDGTNGTNSVQSNYEIAKSKIASIKSMMMDILSYKAKEITTQIHDMPLPVRDIWISKLQELRRKGNDILQRLDSKPTIDTYESCLIVSNIVNEEIDDIIQSYQSIRAGNNSNQQNIDDTMKELIGNIETIYDNASVGLDSNTQADAINKLMTKKYYLASRSKI